MQGKVIARGTIHCPSSELEAMRPLIDEHVRLSRAEPGCLCFDISPSRHDPEIFTVTEEFVDRDAFAAHTARTRASDWWEKSQHLIRNIHIHDRPDEAPVDDWTAPMAPPADLELVGHYVRLERLDAARHGSDLFSANTDDRNWAYLPYGPFENPDDYQRWITKTCTAPDPHFFAIIDITSKRAVGVASYLRIAPEAGSIEVGHINFSPLLQRKAGATEAMFLMMQWAFDAGYRRYEWKCNAANLASRRAAERLGLSYEGVFRQMMVVKGCNRDTAWYAAIDAEWPSLKAAFGTWLAAGNFDASGRQRQALSDLTAPFRVSKDPAL